MINESMSLVVIAHLEISSRVISVSIDPCWAGSFSSVQSSWFSSIHTPFSQLMRDTTL